MSASAFVTVNWLLCALVGCNPAMSCAQPAETASKVETRVAPPNNEDEGADKLPTISVEILGPIRDIKGHSWPVTYDWVYKKANEPASMTTADAPHELIIRLPSGRTIRHISKATFFDQKRGIVDRASLMPHLGVPIKYQDAIGLVESILKQWDAQPDEKTRESLVKWKAEGDLQPWDIAQRLGGAVLRGEDKVGIAFEIRPDWQKKGWFVVIDVAAHWEEVRRILDLPQVSRSQSTTQP